MQNLTPRSDVLWFACVTGLGAVSAGRSVQVLAGSVKHPLEAEKVKQVTCNSSSRVNLSGWAGINARLQGIGVDAFLSLQQLLTHRPALASRGRTHTPSPWYSFIASRRSPLRQSRDDRSVGPSAATSLRARGQPTIARVILSCNKPGD